MVGDDHPAFCFVFRQDSQDGQDFLTQRHRGTKAQRRENISRRDAETQREGSLSGISRVENVENVEWGIPLRGSAYLCVR